MLLIAESRKERRMLNKEELNNLEYHCPQCSEKLSENLIDQVFEKWDGKSSSYYFECDCPHCNDTIRCKLNVTDYDCMGNPKNWEILIESR